MACRVVITKKNNAVITAVIKDDKVFDILASPGSPGFRNGDIYKAKVINIQKNLNAAFLNLVPGVRAFMDLKEGDGVKVDTELPVQITREAFGEKEMLVTPLYSLSGRYVALKNGEGKSGISRKIEGDRRRALTGLLERLMGDTGDISAVIRTNALSAPDAVIEEEFRELLIRITELRRKALYSVPYVKLYSEKREESLLIRDLPWIPEKIVTDDPLIYEGLKEDLQDDEELSGKISLYSDDFPLGKLYRLEAALDEVKKRIIYLRSGGTLYIDKTEACYVIDVNSGKNTEKLSKDELILKTNLEAVREAARQLRIRNIGGMILIDLINMNKKSHRAKVIEELRAEIRKDRIRCNFIDLTGLGIAELTRERVGQPLSEVIKSESASTKNGRC